jgi:hypothetical protein
MLALSKGPDRSRGGHTDPPDWAPYRGPKIGCHKDHARFDHQMLYTNHGRHVDVYDCRGGKGWGCTQEKRMYPISLVVPRRGEDAPRTSGPALGSGERALKIVCLTTAESV